MSLGQFVAIKSNIRNIVFLINPKAKKVFFKVLSRFKKKLLRLKSLKKSVFRSKKSEKNFLGLKKNFF